MQAFLASDLVARSSPDWVGPGLAGFIVIAVLGVAVYFLWRSMNHQLRKVRFEERDGSEQTPGRPTGTPENGQS